MKDGFYADLQYAVQEVPYSDILVVAGDWNARAGPADENTRHTLSRYALGDRCANGDRPVYFAAANRLGVTNTRFQHPTRHLVTWYSNDQRTRNQNDYVLVRARWASSVMDCRAYKGTDTGSLNNSDHALLRAAFRSRLKAHRRRPIPARFDVSKLKTSAADAFKLELRNRFAVLCDVRDSEVQSSWDGFKQSITSAAENRLAFTNTRFEHPRRQLVTWYSNDQRTRN